MNSDLWHFIHNDSDGSWKWKRMSPDGTLVAESPYSFCAFNACVADAGREGLVKDAWSLRRVRSDYWTGAPLTADTLRARRRQDRHAGASRESSPVAARRPPGQDR